MKNDSDFVLSVLQDGPATTTEILNRSFAERGVGAMIHSRVADLRAQGHTIRCTRLANHRGRPVYEYRLVVEPEQIEMFA